MVIVVVVVTVVVMICGGGGNSGGKEQRGSISAHFVWFIDRHFANCHPFTSGLSVPQHNEYTDM